MASAEKARHRAAAQERAEKKSVYDSNSPEKDYSIFDESISTLLMPGTDNGLTLRDLEALTGQDGRTIRRQIEAERRRGVPILSDNKSGYFLPARDSEKTRFVYSMRGRACEILKTALAVECGVAQPAGDKNDGG